MEAADLDALDGQVVAILTSAGRPCTAEQAAVIRARILGRKKLRDPAAYVAAAVRKDPAGAFALCLGGPASNGRGGEHPPARELIARLGKNDPEIAHRGAALARRLLEAKAAGLTAEPEQPDTDEEWPF